MIVKFPLSKSAWKVKNLAAEREKVFTAFSIVAKQHGLENLLQNVKADTLFCDDSMMPSWDAWRLVQTGIDQQKSVNSTQSTGNSTNTALDIPADAWNSSVIYEAAKEKS